MKLREFQNVLLANSRKHLGPFNWLASDYYMEAYALLSSRDKEDALALIYSRYSNTIRNVTDKTSPIEKICGCPAKFQELFKWPYFDINFK